MCIFTQAHIWCVYPLRFAFSLRPTLVCIFTQAHIWCVYALGPTLVCIFAQAHPGNDQRSRPWLFGHRGQCSEEPDSLIGFWAFCTGWANWLKSGFNRSRGQLIRGWREVRRRGCKIMWDNLNTCGIIGNDVKKQQVKWIWWFFFTLCQRRQLKRPKGVEGID